jgi:two-component system chemotaxis response regulator CheB
MSGPVRVLVVEDSLTVQARLVEILRADPELEVVDACTDGKSAIEACRRLKPDVMTLDMVLPAMSGLAVTEYVMAHCPLPILIVSASVNRGEVLRTYDALAAGAVDVLDKQARPDPAWEARLVAAVKRTARIRVLTHPRPRPAPPPSDRVARKTALVAIGASTGGPGAIRQILQALPPRYPLPMLLVLHIAEPFGAGFADWLDAQSPLPAAFAREGMRPAPGTIAVAPPGQHLVLADGRLRLARGPERHSCRPSVDVLFESVARELGAAAAACLLTGMGRDGAAGLLAIRRAGGLTVAQDQATSAVYGMPREAAALEAAQKILPLPQIGPALAELAP